MRRAFVTRSDMLMTVTIACSAVFRVGGGLFAGAWPSRSGAAWNGRARGRTFASGGLIRAQGPPIAQSPPPPCADSAPLDRTTWGTVRPTRRHTAGRAPQTSGERRAHRRCHRREHLVARGRRREHQEQVRHALPPQELDRGSGCRQPLGELLGFVGERVDARPRRSRPEPNRRAPARATAPPRRAPGPWHPGDTAPSTTACPSRSGQVVGVRAVARRSGSGASSTGHSRTWTRMPGARPSRERNASAAARLPPALCPATPRSVGSTSPPAPSAANRSARSRSSRPAGKGCSGASRIVDAQDLRTDGRGERAAQGVVVVEVARDPSAAVGEHERSAVPARGRYRRSARSPSAVSIDSITSSSGSRTHGRVRAELGDRAASSPSASVAPEGIVPARAASRARCARTSGSGDRGWTVSLTVLLCRSAGAGAREAPSVQDTPLAAAPMRRVLDIRPRRYANSRGRQERAYGPRVSRPHPGEQALRRGNTASRGRRNMSA